jgi:hypothetical protein
LGIASKSADVAGGAGNESLIVSQGVEESSHNFSKISNCQNLETTAFANNSPEVKDV